MIEWQIPNEEKDGTISHQKIEIKNDDRVFLLGANGTGKSSLLQNLLMDLDRNYDVTNLTGHRLIHFTNDKMSILPDQKIEAMRNIDNDCRKSDARWTIPNYLQYDNNTVLITELIEKIHARNSKITECFDNNKLNENNIKLLNEIDILQKMNNILNARFIGITLNLTEGRVLQAKKEDTDWYSIKQLSDGERNAILVALNVLLAEKGSVILLDEPELHLHTSKIRPFLESLFDCRPDCPFIIATHEITLATIDSASRIILVRSCKWNNRNATIWEIDVIERKSEEDAFNKIPDDLKVAILGSRKKILFVEGNANSLDTTLYSVLFPDITIVPVASCRDVISSVDSLNGAFKHHHVQAFGIIDRDSRSKINVNNLKKRKIFAIECHSVESLYYDRIAIEVVARSQAEIRKGLDVAETVESAISSAIESLKKNEKSIVNLALKRYEQELRSLIISKIPDRKNISVADENVKICVKNKFNEEKEIIKKLLDEKKWTGLLSRYSLRDSNAFSIIADKLKCKNRQDFENILVTKILDNEELVNALRQKLGGLAEALESKD